MLSVEDEAASTGRRLFGTLLARVAPRSADGRTAQRPCTDDTDQLTATHVRRDLRETRTRTLVYTRLTPLNHRYSVGGATSGCGYRGCGS